MDDTQERTDDEQPSGDGSTPARKPALTPEEMEAAKARAQAAREARAAGGGDAPAAPRKSSLTPEQLEAARARAQAAREARAAAGGGAAAPARAANAAPAAGGAATATAVAPAAPAKVPVARAISAAEGDRRSFVKLGFWGTLGAFGALALVQFLDFFWPRGVAGFGGKVSAGKVSDYPAGGDPKRNNEGRFWMVHVTPEKGGEGKYQGLLALWQRCPHLGCTVPWRGDAIFNGRPGWFLCPCHGSTYSYAGVRVFGPAPRSMDTMLITVDGSGNIVVDTAARTPGGSTAEDNPSRAVKV